MRKLRTEIKGLDALFHGGIQIDNLTSASQSSTRDSIIIVIRGEKGTHKHLLAMQLMHGLTKSIKNRLEEKNSNNCNYYPSRFYSINKSTQSLNDMFIDLLIRRWLDAMTRAIKRRNVNSENENETVKMSLAYNERLAALKFWFNCIPDSTLSPTLIREHIVKSVESDIIKLIADNFIYYNVRTNSLHFRRLAQGDSNDNLLFKRGSDTIKEYREKYNTSAPDLKGYTEVSETYSLCDEMVNIDFYQDKGSEESPIDRYSQKAAKRFFSILEHIENGERDEQELTPTTTDNDDKYREKTKREVIVIDGFSHIDSKSLKALPFDHLHKTLRSKARVSILVFDDRPDISCDGDIIIDLRKSYDESEDYTYSELQISKCTFQTHALGWHQYKRRDEGIVVFPSVHLLLTKRHYISNMANDIGKSILDVTYSQYAEAKLFSDNVARRLEQMLVTDEKDSSNNMSNYANDFYYPEYKIQTLNSNKDFINQLIEKQVQLINRTGDGDLYLMEYLSNKERSKDIFKTVFDSTIFGSDNLEITSTPFGWIDHYASTALIGNPNSYKRKLVLGHSFHWAKQKEHVLFVLFDKNEEDLRRQMVCPGMIGKAKIYSNGEEKWDCGECLLCYRYIHFFRIRSGCISPEEFFATLLDQISIYCDEEPRYGIERRRLHIVIDDFQRIDFCFPFIKSSSLFTDALINLCHMHNVDLTILCDKSGERAREVCTLADNVICVERNEKDINSISLFIERTSYPPYPSAILKYRINNVENMFTCSSENLNIDFDSGEITSMLLGSMKEYWRQTENISIKKSNSRINPNHNSDGDEN